MTTRHRKAPEGAATDAASDRGASYLEYLALCVLAALILIGLAPLAGDGLTSGINRVICQIVNGGDASSCPETSGGGDKKLDINPQWCVSSTHSDGGDVGWAGTLKKIINISIGRGYKIIRYDSREEDSDGKVKHMVYLQFVDSADGSLDLGKAGEKLNIGGGAEVNYGDMYRLTPEEADKYIQDIQTYQQVKLESEVDGVPGVMAVNSIGRDWPPKIAKDPAITYGGSSAEGHGSYDKKIPVNNLPSPDKYVVPNGGTVSTTQSKALTTEHWNNIYKDANGKPAPATAVYHTNSGTYSVGAKRAGKKAGESGRGVKGEANATKTWDYSNTTRVTTDDKTGDLKNIRYVVTYGDEGSLGAEFGITGKKSGGKDGRSIGGGSEHGTGKLHTEVVQLNFDTPEERAIGEKWLKTHGTEMPPSVANQIFGKTGASPGIPDDKQSAEPPGPDADPFDQLVFNKGRGWKTDADTKSQAYHLNATLPFGAGSIGPYGDFESSDSKTTRAQILDRPGADGSRHWIDYPDCTAKGNH